MWEDLVNVNGGKWVIFFCLLFGIFDIVWVNLMMVFVGEIFDLEN